jgi:CHAT domain-containing protein
MLRKPLVLFFLMSFVLLSQNATSLTNIWDGLDDEIAKREGGCSEERINDIFQLKEELSSGFKEAASTRSEIAVSYEDAQAQVDVLLSACIRFKDPQTSLEIMQSVRSRFDELSKDRFDISSNNKSNKAEVIEFYLIYWYLPYFTNDLESEAIELFKNDYNYFENLVEQNELAAYEFVYANHLFLELFEEEKDLEFVSEYQKILVRQINRSHQPESLEMNTKLANLLKDVRLSIIGDLYNYGDYESLAAELTQFNQIYFNQYTEGRILSNEFANDIANTLDFDIDLVNKIMPTLEITLSNQDLHWLIYYILDLPRDLKFPAFGQIKENLYTILRDRLLKNNTTQDLIELLTNSDGTPSDEYSGFTYWLSMDFTRKENCDGLFNSENPLSNYRYLSGETPIDFFYNINFAKIKTACEPSSDNYYAEQDIYRDFIDKYANEIKKNRFNLFTDQWIESLRNLEHVLAIDIYRSTIFQIMELLEDWDEQSMELLLSKIQLADDVFDLQDESVVIDGQSILEQQEEAIDARDFASIINKRLQEEGILAQLEHVKEIESYLENDIWDFNNLNSEFILNYAEMLNQNELIGFIDDYINKVDSYFWIYLRDEDNNSVTENFFNQNINITASLVDIFYRRILNENPVMEPRFDRIYHRPFSNLISLYANLLTYRSVILENITKEKYTELSLELSKHSLRARLNDISELILMNRISGQTKDSDLNDSFVAYLEFMGALRQFSENKIISKDGNQFSRDYINSLEIGYKEEARKYKSDLLNLGIAENEMHSKFYSITSDMIMMNLEEDEAMMTFNVDYDPRVERPGFIQIFIYTKDAVYFNFSESIVKDSVEEYMSNFSLESAVNDQFDINQSSEIYDSLFNIVVNGVTFWSIKETGIKKLYIVPDRHLNGFPFHTLYNAKDERWLIEEVDIRYLPDEISYLLLDEQYTDYEDQLFVGIGDPFLQGSRSETQFEKLFDLRGNIDKKKLSQLTSLPSTKYELQSMSKRFNKKKLLLGKNANESFLKENGIEDASIISFATHAVEDISNSSYEVGLVLTPPKQDQENDDGLLTKSEIASLALNNPTVILSACNTSRGLYKGADFLSGLPAGFFQAGANSIITSSWDLETNSAAIISSLAMEIAIQDNLPIGSGYNQAMKEFIRNPKYKDYSHPYFWAGFQTIGK